MELTSLPCHLGMADCTWAAAAAADAGTGVPVMNRACWATQQERGRADARGSVRVREVRTSRASAARGSPQEGAVPV